MTLRFAYQRIGVARPLASLHGRMDRPRPYVTVTILGPTGTAIEKALIDTGADDTVFPEWMAWKIGLDLSNAPWGTSRGSGRGSGLLRFAQVTLRIADHY